MEKMNVGKSVVDISEVFHGGVLGHSGGKKESVK